MKKPDQGFCMTSTECILELLTSAWTRELKPLNTFREFTSTPVITGIAWLLYQGVIQEDWKAMALTIGVLENMGIAYVADVVTKFALLLLSSPQNANIKRFIKHVVFGGEYHFDDFQKKTPIIAYNTLSRIAIPAAIVSIQAGNFFLGANSETEESSWNYGSFLAQLGIGLGLGAATGLVYDNAAKLTNFVTDKTYGFFKSRQNKDEEIIEVTDQVKNYQTFDV